MMDQGLLLLPLPCLFLWSMIIISLLPFKLLLLNSMFIIPNLRLLFILFPMLVEDLLLDLLLREFIAGPKKMMID